MIISYLSINKITVRLNTKKKKKKTCNFSKLFNHLPEENNQNIWIVNLTFNSSYLN